MMNNNFDYGSLDTKDLVMMIEKEVEIDLERAKVMLSFVDKSTNPIEYQYLYGMIREKEIYFKYDDGMKKKFDEYLSKGRIALENKDYTQAYNLFVAGYDATKNNIFNYYMGKTLFKSESRIAACPYFIVYNRFGGSKLPRALLYTMSIYREIGNPKEARKYYTQLSYINETFSHGFKLDSPFNKKGKLKGRKKRNKKNDGRNLVLEEYYDYDFDKRILIIERLFRDRKYSIAIRLLKELKPKDKNQRIIVQELERKKILYKNKMSN